PVPERVLARIGDITVSFAVLEMTIQGLAASQLQESQRIGQIITAEIKARDAKGCLGTDKVSAVLRKVLLTVSLLVSVAPSAALADSVSISAVDAGGGKMPSRPSKREAFAASVTSTFGSESLTRCAIPSSP